MGHGLTTLAFSCRRWGRVHFAKEKEKRGERAPVVKCSRRGEGFLQEKEKRGREGGNEQTWHFILHGYDTGYNMRYGGTFKSTGHSWHTNKRVS